MEENRSGNRNGSRNRDWSWQIRRFWGILALTVCLFAPSLGLSACGPQEPEATESSVEGTVIEERENLEENAATETAESLSEGTALETAGSPVEEEAALSVEEDGAYSDRDHVALYLHIYGRLPDNYMTKSEAGRLGWEPDRGNLWEVAPGASIGGDRFGNREGMLPEADGRNYYECDINYGGGFRGGERIVYSSDGSIYYSEDHYENFQLLYTKEGKAE